MGMIFLSHANKTHFQRKGCALRLILKVRVFGIRKWPIDVVFLEGNQLSGSLGSLGTKRACAYKGHAFLACVQTPVSYCRIGESKATASSNGI